MAETASAPAPATVTEFAPAKINLTLHVTGRRADGYHLLDSLVVFADVGDRISALPATDLSLTITGPHAGTLSATDNLVLMAARLMHPASGARITLDKHLPVASGIGGGSADAAATLRALGRLWGLPLPPGSEVLGLGADVPVCLSGRSHRMRGTGETLDPVRLPPGWLVLVNPGVAVATRDVFAQLDRQDHPAMPGTLPVCDTAVELAALLQSMRNDLEPAAIALAPDIARCKAAVAHQSGCLIARMSGSGATCFGLFADRGLARNAARALQAAHPGWWVRAAAMLS